jgi:hypothetical protein
LVEESLMSGSKKTTQPPSGPDFSGIDSQAKAEARG